MSLISMPNELLLRYVFSCDAISINDLKCIMLSCHRLYKVIRESNELWRVKFLTRWPRVFLQTDIDQRWFEWVSLRLKVSNVVKKTVEPLSALYHPDGKIPMSILDKLIEKGEMEHPTLLFVEDELQDLAFNQKKNENLTSSYYASVVLDNLKRFIQFKNWQEFRAQQPPQKSLLKGAVLVSLWFQNCLSDVRHFISLSEIECALEKISQKVKEEFLLMENALSAVNDYVDPIKNGEKLLNIISKVLFNDMSFRVTINEDHHDNLLSIDRVLETGEGCSTILCIIYYEIASMMGIKCDAVYYKDKLLLRWREYSQKSNAYSFFYIDVCDRGCLKHSVHYPSTLHYKPAASVEHILQQMMHEFNESVKEIIRTNEFDDSMYIFHLKCWQSDSVRLACAITPHSIPYIMEYAELCINDGMYLDDAIHLLQSVGCEDDDSLIIRCKNELTRYQEEINEAKIACNRVPTIKYAVGLVMNYTYTYEDPENGEVIMCNDTCVITSWDAMFKESKEWTTGKGVHNLDQPFYHILLDEDSPGFTNSYFFGHFNVAEETLELHPTGVSIKHQELGNYFERFDGRKYVPNAEVRTRFPEDVEAASEIIVER